MGLQEAEELYKKMLEKIREVRKEKNISQTQIAQEVGMTQTSYSDAENGTTKFKPVQLLATLDYLGITIFTNPQPQQLIAIDPDQLVQEIVRQGKELEEMKQMLKQILQNQKKE